MKKKTPLRRTGTGDIFYLHYRALCCSTSWILRTKWPFLFRPFQNFCSRAGLEALGSCLNNKYSEGYPNQRSVCRIDNDNKKKEHTQPANKQWTGRIPSHCFPESIYRFIGRSLTRFTAAFQKTQPPFRVVSGGNSESCDSAEPPRCWFSFDRTLGPTRNPRESFPLHRQADRSRIIDGGVNPCFVSSWFHFVTTRARGCARAVPSNPCFSFKTYT